MFSVRTNSKFHFVRAAVGKFHCQTTHTTK